MLLSSLWKIVFISANVLIVISGMAMAFCGWEAMTPEKFTLAHTEFIPLVSRTCYSIFFFGIFVGIVGIIGLLHLVVRSDLFFLIYKIPLLCVASFAVIVLGVLSLFVVEIVQVAERNHMIEMMTGLWKKRDDMDTIEYHNNCCGVKEAEAEEGEPLPPRARPDSLRSLTKATRFTEQELKRIYRGFKAECPSGLVREDTFRSIYSQFFPQGANSSQYATYVFHTLDQANSGTLSFQDLVRGLSVLCRGSVEERLKWTFTLYDINKDGKITKDELADVITSVYSLLGRLSPHHGEDENDPLSSKIDVIFQRLDQNKDGVVTWEEFFEACTSDETITSSMAVFDSAI